jgi:hypothetical protein
MEDGSVSRAVGEGAGESAALEPAVRVSRYTVSCLPESEVDRGSWDIDVEERGGGRWAVLKRVGQCLGSDGRFVYEPSPSNRTDEFLAAHRFGLDEALALARRAAPEVVVNGMRPVDVIAFRKAHPQDD